MQAQTSINAVRSYLKELMLQTEKELTYVCIDYLDLLMPSGAKVSLENLFVKDKLVSEELRNLAKELGIIVVTASQLNRSAEEEIEYSHATIAGGKSKIDTADNVFGIRTSRSMRENGRYELQFMKTRNSYGTGYSVALGYNRDCMRIFDIEQDDSAETKTSNIIDKIKNRTSSVVSKSKDEDVKLTPVQSVQADVQGSKLRDMLANLKANKPNTH